MPVPDDIIRRPFTYSPQYAAPVPPHLFAGLLVSVPSNDGAYYEPTDYGYARVPMVDMADKVHFPLRSVVMWWNRSGGFLGWGIFDAASGGRLLRWDVFPPWFLDAEIRRANYLWEKRQRVYHLSRRRHRR